MLNNEKLREARDKLLAQVMIPETEVNDLFHKAVDNGYWRSLCPEM